LNDFTLFSTTCIDSIEFHMLLNVLFGSWEGSTPQTPPNLS
jgi:hypothetical protein